MNLYCLIGDRRWKVDTNNKMAGKIYIYRTGCRLPIYNRLAKAV
jgi:hypothetical protein